jgi:sugar diacid utilization regulator
MAEARQKTPAKPSRSKGAGVDALDALAEAVESGAGLPETARRAAAALGAIVALIDSRGAVLAVAAGSPSEERELLSAKEGVTSIDLRVSEAVVGQLRFRARSARPEPAMLRMVTTLLALEVERTRAPERAGEAAVGSFVNAVLDHEVEDRRDLIARGKELGIDLEDGGSVLIVNLHARQPAEGDWQARALTVVGRAARGVASGSLVALRHDHVAVLVPGSDENTARRAAQSALNAVDDTMAGFAAVIGRSRVATRARGFFRSTTPAPTGSSCRR